MFLECTAKILIYLELTSCKPQVSAVPDMTSDRSSVACYRMIDVKIHILAIIIDLNRASE